MSWLPLGRKVADVYAELNLDKDTIRSAMAAAGSEMGADADRLGRQLGDRMSKGMAGQVEQLSARLAKARLAEQKATDAVALAQARLNEAESKGNVEGSRLLALQQRLSQAEAALAVAHDNTAKATTRHADAEKRLATDIENLGRTTGPAADRAGRDTGDKLSQGIHLAIIRNSPLIAAGIGAALAAGAPAALAGATLLFAGIGVAGAAMNETVKKRWSEAWQSIVTGTKQDATILQRTVADTAGQVAAGFGALRPAMRLIFADVQTYIQPFVASLITAAQNAMPGLVNAVHAAQPVMAGLGTLVEDIGTGLSGFFDAISQHSQAAGTAFAAIGQIVQTLLPVLGDLLGQGAELASIVLPPLASALGLVGDALHFIAPILPTVAMGFGAFKIVTALSGPISSMAGSLTKFAQNAAIASYQGGAFGNAAGAMSNGASRASGALSSLGTALPVVGLAVAAVSAAYAAGQEDTDRWAQAILNGGAAAAQASKEMQDSASSRALLQGFFAATADDATQKAQDMLAAMTPLQQAQQGVTAAQNDLNGAVNTYGADSPQAAWAAGGLANAQAEVAYQNNLAELAIEGVTGAMIAQANQALAAASSSFAYDQATQQVADAQQHLIDVQNDGKATQSDLNNATNSLNQALLSQAEAAGRLASDALPSTASEMDHNTASAQATLQELYKLRDQMGSQFPAALQTAITGLENSGAAMSNTGGQATGASGQVQGLATQLINAGIIHVSPTIGINNQASAILETVKSQIAGINSKTVTITTVYRQSGITVGGGMTTIRGQAMGGPVDEVIRAATGRVVGPGGPTDDLVPAVGPGGQPWRLSPGEWVVKEAAVRALEAQYGKAAMPTINSGRLPVATDTGSSGSLVKVQGGAAGGGVTINGGLTLQINGAYNLGDDADKRRLLQDIRDGLIKLDREGR